MIPEKVEDVVNVIGNNDLQNGYKRYCEHEADMLGTYYALQAGASTNNNKKTADSDVVGWWWLRSPGFYQNFAGVVNYRGLLTFYNVNSVGGVVRPALWINLESDIF